jgi:hypothetical protein
MDVKNLNTLELINAYSKIINTLKQRGVIRTKNLIGDIGEYLAIEHFNKTSGKPNLQFAPAGTKNIDAISRNGDRYSIKSTSSNLTGVFYGLEKLDSNKENSQKFEYLLIVQFKDNFSLQRIIQLDWTTFLHFKRWHKTMNAWNISVTKKLLEKSDIIYENTAKP